MISDILHGAIVEIDGCLRSPDYAKTYSGVMRKRIEDLVSQMNAVLADLDKPPLVV